MSLSRKKVEVDPLSFFIEENQKKLHEDEEPEVEEIPPVQSHLVEVKEVLSSPSIINTNTTTSTETKTKGVKFTDPEETIESNPPALKPVLKAIKVVLIDEPKKKPKDETPLDVLFSAEYNRQTELLLSAEEDFFASEENSPKPNSSSTTTFSSTTKGSKNNAINFQTTDEEDYSDLKVAKLLEREQGLDEQIFGNISSIPQKNEQKKNISSSDGRKNELDSEQSFLKELDEITIKPKYVSSLSRSNDSEKSASRLTTNTIAEKKIDIDINALDVNSYINQESNDSGGGLFD